MCRNIRKLRSPERQPTQDELKDAARQFVRKITGFQKPSQKNSEAFEEAVLNIVDVTGALFEKIHISKPETE